MAKQRRTLVFHNYQDAKADLEQLLARGYDQVGKWDLSQVCDHLAYFVEASLDGAKFRVPWLIKFLFGKSALRRIMRENRMPEGAPTPQKPLPTPGGDEPAAAKRLLAQLDRLEAHRGPWHASPFFGDLSPEEWRRLHLLHLAHHMSFLTPKG